MEYVPAKGQRFDIKRTINFALCNCEKCDFMNCPKNNYAVKMVRKKHTVKDFFEANKDEVIKINQPKKWMYSFHNLYQPILTYELINEMFDMIPFGFPKGTYWSLSDPKSCDDEIEKRVYYTITLSKFHHSGREVTRGTIDIRNQRIWNLDLSTAQEKLANRICDAIRQLRELIFEHYQTLHADWKIGWLSREGRFYPCHYGEHSTLASALGGTEFGFENKGWVKVMMEDEDLGWYCDARLSAEQRNWLSLNGYYFDE